MGGAAGHETRECQGKSGQIKEILFKENVSQELASMPLFGGSTVVWPRAGGLMGRVQDMCD